MKNKFWINRFLFGRANSTSGVEYPPILKKKKHRSDSKIVTYYRLSDTGYSKVKPDYIDNSNCLSNYVKQFGKENLYIIADNITDETYEKLCLLYSNIERTDFGNGAQSFNHTLDLALGQDKNTIIYFLENDYLHKPDSRRVLIEGINTGADYVSLYDHPDKYIDKSKGGNPHIDGGGELTRVLLTESVHWKFTNSTTMTFAARVKTLKEDENILRKYTVGIHPKDFDMFVELRRKSKTLITPIPGYSTHGETKWLGPLTDWSIV